MKKIFSNRNYEVLKNSNGLLIGYITAGYPNEEDFLDVIINCENSGVDIFELGYPSEDPFADGDVIKNAHEKVDKSITRNINYWKKIRSVIHKPIWIMGYSSDLIDNNIYIELSKAEVVDGFVIPDLDFEKSFKIAEDLNEFGVDLIAFVENGSEKIKEYFTTFPLIYYQLVKGKTGSGAKTEVDYDEIHNLIDEYRDCYLFGGFGISSKEKAVEVLNEGMTGAIIGTTFIKKLNDSPKKLYSFVKEIKNMINQRGE